MISVSRSFPDNANLWEIPNFLSVIVRVLFLDSPILFSPRFVFFLFFLYDSIPALSRSPESVPNFSPISTTQIFEWCYHKFIDNLFDPLRCFARWTDVPILALSELSSRFHPYIFSQLFQSHRPIVIPFTLPSCSPQCSRAMHRKLSIPFITVVIVDSGDYRERSLPICVKLNLPAF